MSWRMPLCTCRPGEDVIAQDKPWLPYSALSAYHTYIHMIQTISIVCIYEPETSCIRAHPSANRAIGHTCHILPPSVKTGVRQVILTIVV